MGETMKQHFTMRLPLFLVLLLSLVAYSACRGETGFYDWDAGVEPDVPIDVPIDVPEDIVEPDVDIIVDPVCGNGIIEEGEVCDDGNTRSGDGCNASCTLADGVDFVGNTVYVRNQEYPVLVGTPNEEGDFFLLFTDWSGADGGGAGIRMGRFAADGRRRGEITVNNVVGGGNQHSPAGAVAGDRLLVVWLNEMAGGTFDAGIRGRIFNLEGQQALPEFQVDTSFIGQDLHVSVAANDSGMFLVVWVDASGTGGADLKGRFIQADGTPGINSITADDGEFHLDIPAAGLQIRPRVYAISGNRWMVLYEDFSGAYDPTTGGITGVLLTTDGGTINTFGVNQITAGRQADVSALQLPSGMVACWIDNSNTFDLWEWGIHCRLFDAGYQPVGEDFLVNTTTKTSQLAPALCLLDTGFLVIWEDWSSQDGYGAGVVGRRFALDGTPLTPEFAIPSTFLGHQTNPTCLRRDYLFWFAWEDTSGAPPDTDGKAIRLRSFLEENMVQ